jgi:hypothetical protein
VFLSRFVDIFESNLLVNMVYRNKTSDENSFHNGDCTQIFTVCMLHPVLLWCSEYGS